MLFHVLLDRPNLFLNIIVVLAILLSMCCEIPRLDLFDTPIGSVKDINKNLRAFLSFVVYFVVLSVFMIIPFYANNKFKNKLFFRVYCVYWFIAAPLAFSCLMALLSPTGKGDISANITWGEIKDLIMIFLWSMALFCWIPLLPAIVQRYNLLSFLKGNVR
ncbi:MAG: hypothetical protein AXA67_01835 [Methylothermaceae bacteria B42]|nr:MAG: hypothetical protein AXA67_01835 [Methylothermaceae bacteria B42]HHJ37842.1 hypothetical protein [Methylothermaceae bacterium]